MHVQGPNRVLKVHEHTDANTIISLVIILESYIIYSTNFCYLTNNVL